MYTNTRYSAKQLAYWTRFEVYWFAFLAILLVILFEIFELTFIQLPWAPVAVIGTAVAFIIGFQNNSAYGRIWEARKIWGGIVNTSRTWGMKIQDMVTNEHAKSPMTDEELRKEKSMFIYRHIAWLTALRHSMRQRKKWEVFEEHTTNKEWSKMVHIPEKITSVEDDLLEYLCEEEREHVLSKGNKSTALLYLQSAHLRKLKEKGFIWEFAFLELENVLEEMFTLQGKSERIKNFPYPRQYATLSYFFVWMFAILLPFAVIPEFAKLGLKLSETYPLAEDYFVWMAVPFCIVVSWIFHTMERIGRVGENPFEGSSNDVPISTIARAIEIDLREQMGEDTKTIPGQFPEQGNVQM